MPAKKDPPLTDDERAKRIRELAEEAGTSDDPEVFERAFEKVARSRPEAGTDQPAGPRTNNG